MTTQPFYTQGRASALPPDDVGSVQSSKPEYQLIDHLRIARANGDEAMTAAEQYDPDFSIKLSNCTSDEAAEALLADWLDRRVAVLKHTQDALREAWRNVSRTA